MRIIIKSFAFKAESNNKLRYKNDPQSFTRSMRKSTSKTSGGILSWVYQLRRFSIKKTCLSLSQNHSREIISDQEALHRVSHSLLMNY